MSDILMKQATFRRLLFRAVTLPLGVMALLAVALIWQITRLLDASRWVDHSDKVIAQAHETLNLLVDMETGQRGYLVSGQALFLEPYNQATSSFPAAFTTLQDLVVDNPQQSQHLVSIHSLSQEWADNAGVEITLRKQGKDYRAAFATARGKRLMDNLRTQFKAFIGAEESLRIQRFQKTSQDASVTLVGTLSLALILGLTLALANRRQLSSLSQAYEQSLRVTLSQTETLQQQAAALQVSEAHRTTTLRSIGDAVIATNAQGKVTFLNPVAERLTGWTQAEAAGKDLKEVFVICNEQTRQPVESPVEKVLREGAVVGLANHTVVISRDGTETPIDDTGAPIRDETGTLSGVVLVFHDITERKRSEEALREREADFRMLFADNPHPMWVYDLETLAFLEVNEAAISQYGYSRDEFLRMRITDIRPEEEVERLLEDVSSERPSIQRSSGWRHRRKNGQVMDMEITSHILGFTGRRAVLVIANDITERKQVQQALKESEEQFRATFEQAAVGIAQVGADFQWVRVNRKLCEILGYSREELLKRTFKEITHPDDIDVDLANGLRMVAGEIQYYSVVKRNLRKDGSVVWINLTVSLVRQPTGEPKYFISVLEDITERKRLENQLLEAQKLESLGRLAGGVAHDFNNLLTIIMGYTELLEASQALDTTSLEYLKNVVHAAEKASNLTRQLLAFARRQMIEPKVLNLNNLILSLDKMLRRLIGEHIELVMLPDDALHAVKVDPGQFEQILVNLVVNARDAMLDGGKITIETHNAILDVEYVRQHEGVTPGEYVLLAVSDTGSGMEDEIRLHIFEPFFTTKEKGRGTGLGLATVYGIVKQAGGHIWLFSEVGEGTTFKIYLPRVAEAAEALAEITHPAPSLDGTETILIAEDEPLVRDLATQTLRGHGYTVLEAMSGEER